MADEGKGESVFVSSMSKSTDDHVTDRDDNGRKPFSSTFAFYKYETQRDKPESETSSTSSAVSATAAATGKTDNFSLNLLTSSLDTNDESLLQKFLTRKLSKNGSDVGNGHIASVELGLGEPDLSLSLCYFCLLRQRGSSPAASTTLVTPDDLASLGLDDLDLPDLSAETGGDPETYVVCLIAPIESQLDLFKADLDKFSTNLLSKLDIEIFLLLDLEETNETSDVVAIVKPHLETWYTKTTSFLSDCVTRLDADLQYLIHAALTDSTIDIDCSDNEFKNDIRRFVECCSLSDLLSTQAPCSPDRRPSPDPGVDLLIDVTADARTTRPATALSASQYRVSGNVSITVADDGTVSTEKSQECSKFCGDWAQALLNCDQDNVSMLRQVIEGYKLKAIQDMNTLKRLLKQAEADHYSLYRCYMFLQQCGHGSILLQHADQELSVTASCDTSRVLGVLYEYIQQAGGLAVR